MQMSRLQRLDRVTGSRERTHAFLGAMQGQEAVTISHGRFYDMKGIGFGTQFRFYYLVNAEVHAVPEKAGIFAWEEEPAVTFAKDKSGVNKDATAEAVYYDDRYGGPLVKPRVHLLGSIPHRSDSGFQSVVTGHVTAGTIILDGEDPMAEIRVEDFPRNYGEYNASRPNEVTRFTLTMGAAGMLLDQLNATRPKHPIVPAFTTTLGAVL